MQSEHEGLLAQLQGVVNRVMRKGAHKVVLGPPPHPNRVEHPYTNSLDYQGMQILIENPVGSTREGHGWRTKMTAHYGELADTLGLDGDPVDVFVGPDPAAPMAYVVHQKHPGTQVPDEDKVVLGVHSLAAARALYMRHYDKPGFFDGVTSWPVAELRAHLEQYALAGKRLDQPAHVRERMAKGLPPHPGLVLLPVKGNPSIKRWQKPHAAQPEPEKKKGGWSADFDEAVAEVEAEGHVHTVKSAQAALDKITDPTIDDDDMDYALTFATKLLKQPGMKEEFGPTLEAKGHLWLWDAYVTQGENDEHLQAVFKDEDLGEDGEEREAEAEASRIAALVEEAKEAAANGNLTRVVEILRQGVTDIDFAGLREAVFNSMKWNSGAWLIEGLDGQITFDGANRAVAFLSLDGQPLWKSKHVVDTYWGDDPDVNAKDFREQVDDRRGWAGEIASHIVKIIRKPTITASPKSPTVREARGIELTYKPHILTTFDGETFEVSEVYHDGKRIGATMPRDAQGHYADALGMAGWGDSNVKFTGTNQTQHLVDLTAWRAEMANPHMKATNLPVTEVLAKADHPDDIDEGFARQAFLMKAHQHYQEDLGDVTTFANELSMLTKSGGFRFPENAQERRVLDAVALWSTANVASVRDPAKYLPAEANYATDGNVQATYQRKGFGGVLYLGPWQTAPSGGAYESASEVMVALSSVRGLDARAEEAGGRRPMHRGLKGVDASFIEMLESAHESGAAVDVGSVASFSYRHSTAKSFAGRGEAPGTFGVLLTVNEPEVGTYIAGMSGYSGEEEIVSSAPLKITEMSLVGHTWHVTCEQHPDALRKAVQHSMLAEALAGRMHGGERLREAAAFEAARPDPRIVHKIHKELRSAQVEEGDYTSARLAREALDRFSPTWRSADLDPQQERQVLEMAATLLTERGNDDG